MVRNTQLPHSQPREFKFPLKEARSGDSAVMDVTVRYHLLDEARRKKIGYDSVEPIAYPVYHERIPLDPRE